MFMLCLGCRYFFLILKRLPCIYNDASNNLLMISYCSFNGNMTSNISLKIIFVMYNSFVYKFYFLIDACDSNWKFQMGQMCIQNHTKAKIELLFGSTYQKDIFYIKDVKWDGCASQGIRPPTSTITWYLCVSVYFTYLLLRQTR